MKEDRVVFEFVRTNFYTRRTCHLCGGHTEKVDVLTEVKQGAEEGLRVCEQCLRAGTEAVYAKMERHAAWLEQRAADVRGLVGRLELPSYAEWEAEMDKAGAEYRQAMLSEERQEPATENQDDQPF